MHHTITQADLDEADAALNAERRRVHADITHDLLLIGADLGLLLKQKIANQMQMVTRPKEYGLIEQPDLVIPYERLCRTVRRNILLAERLAEPPKPSLPSPTANPTPAKPPESPPDPPCEPRDRLDRLDRLETIRLDTLEEDTVSLADLETPDFSKFEADTRAAYAATCRDLEVPLPAALHPFKKRPDIHPTG